MVLACGFGGDRLCRHRGDERIQGASGRVELVNDDGTPVADTSWSNANGTPNGREFDYATQTWYTTNGQGLAQNPLSDFSGELALGNVIKNQLANGRLENVQSTTLNGEPALEISGTVMIYRASAKAVGNTGTPGNSGSGTAQAAARAVAGERVTLSGTESEWTVWVDPASCLPIQMVEISEDGTTATSSIK
jgi:hypothetical protein